MLDVVANRYDGDDGDDVKYAAGQASSPKEVSTPIAS